LFYDKFHMYKADSFESNNEKVQLQMWANAQCDGRPAEYRWHPLFNAAKFG